MKKKSGINFKYSNIENLVLLGLVLSFLIILTPLAYTSLPSASFETKNDVITGLATSNIMEPDVTTALLIIFAIAFLIPVELMLRKNDKYIKHRSR